MSFNKISIILVLFIISDIQFLIDSIVPQFECDLFKVKNGVVRFNPKRNFAYVRCKPDYTLVGGNNVTCTNGSWPEAIPGCPHQDCLTDDLKTIPKNGHSFVFVIHNVVFIKYSCKKGYVLGGQKDNTCKEGIWKYKNHSVCL
ncbi:sushi, von Willebrand factor type A, EGF and pentraxin domain-containing protein 1-like [Leptopilina heterotoma]|uniref:sushi, von Willebrand factor type A, EGF and pentraxin domain-containing protein 1-like n=1 Tax=Leptopilina heterotoma TaxID=63436 RepID=UPI001CA8E99D|nr:sushi, von Willebrand factor type A, EGF and pentraxin domain-containing protein 1-like [Leptopilina heterotoma]